MLLKIHPDNPNERNIKIVIECLKGGGTVIYPTDTVYALGCDIFKHKAVEKIAMIKGIKLSKANFSFVCYDLKHLSDFARPLSNNVYRVMKKALPGPFTFIVEANSNVPRIFQSNKKTIGIRVPDNLIIREIVKELGNPVMSTSVYDDDSIIEYTTDSEIIHERYKDIVDIVIDGGYGGNQPSTVIDCVNDSFNVVRQGKGDIENYL